MVCAAGVLLSYALRNRMLPNAEILTTFAPPRLFGSSLLAVSLISSLFALLQHFNLEALFAPWINPTEPGFAFANLRQRNQFASLTNLALAVLLAWAMWRGNEKIDGRVGVLALAGAALLAIGNAASSSRTGVVQIILLCALFGLWGGWRNHWVNGVRLQYCSVKLKAFFTRMSVFSFTCKASLPFLEG